MAWTLTASGSKQGTGATNAVSVTGLNTGSSNIIWAFVGSYNGAGPAATDLTDTQGNSYSLITSQASAADALLRIDTYYKITPSNSAALGVTFTPPSGTTGNYPSLIVYAFTQGSAPTFNTNVQTGTNSAGTVTPGSIGNANDLVVEAMSFYSTGGNTLSGSFSSVTEVAYLAANAMGIAAAWKEIASAVNPAWTTNSGNAIAAQAAAVSGVGGGGGGRGLFRVPSLSGVGIGGSFFRDPLQAREQMVRDGDLYVPERLAA